MGSVEFLRKLHKSVWQPRQSESPRYKGKSPNPPSIASKGTSRWMPLMLANVSLAGRRLKNAIKPKWKDDEQEEIRTGILERRDRHQTPAQGNWELVLMRQVTRSHPLMDKSEQGSLKPPRKQRVFPNLRLGPLMQACLGEGSSGQLK